MNWTERDEKVWSEIKDWEKRHFVDEPNDISGTYQQWLEARFAKLDTTLQKRVFHTIDAMLFHLHALIQNSQFQLEARQRLLNEARLFDATIEKIPDMKRLTIDELRYISSQHMTRQRVFSFAQGGLTGTGGIFLLGVDFPAVIAMNLRAVQLIGLNYGYEVGLPSEMMTALKVFHTASLPKKRQHQSWRDLEEEVFEQDHDPYFYEGTETFNDSLWLQYAMKQLVKVVAIQMLRKKVIQGVPLLGMAVGAGMNYQFSRQVTELAHQFYQKRHLLEKKQWTEG